MTGPAHSSEVRHVSLEPRDGYYQVVEDDLIAYVKHGYVLVACAGPAHRGIAPLDECVLCANGPWGWCAVPG